MTARTTMPRDASGTYVQVMRAKTAHQITIAGASDRNSSAFEAGARVVEIYADVACYWMTGDVTITASATDHYLPAGHARVYSLGGDKQDQHTHLAVIQASAGGTIWISELE